MNNMTRGMVRIISGGLLAAVLGALGGYAGNAVAQTNAAGSASAADKISALLGDEVLARGKGLEIKRSEFGMTFGPDRVVDEVSLAVTVGRPTPKITPQ